MQAKAQAVLPRFIAPPAPLCLWLLLLCFMALGGLLFLTRVPVYRNGVATVVDSKNEQLIVAFFPPESQSEIRTGQNLSLKLDPDGPPLVRAIAAIEPEILSPAEAHKKFNPGGDRDRAYQTPAAIAIARLGRPSEKLPASAYEGSVVEARIEVGSQRLLALLPVVGRFF